MKRILVSLLLCILCGAAFAESFVVGKSRTIGRIARVNKDNADNEDNLRLWLVNDYDDDTNYFDYSTFINDGVQSTVSAQPAYSNVNNGMLWFDNIGDYIQGSTPPYIPSKFDGITMMAWVRPSATSQNDYIYLSGDTLGSASDQSALMFMLRNTSVGNTTNYKVQYLWSSHGNLCQILSDSTPIEIDLWQHIAVTMPDAGASNASMAIMLNGNPLDIFVSNDNASRTYLSYSNDFVIGCENVGALGGFFPGGMDDVRMYDQAIGVAAISNIYNKTLLDYWPAWDLTDPSYASTVLSYPFKVDPPTTNFWVQDYSHENPDATLQGGNVGSQIIANSQPAFSNNGSYLQFDGIDDFLYRRGITSNDFGQAKYTRMFWIRRSAPDTGGNHHLSNYGIWSGAEAWSQRFIFGQDNDLLEIRIRTNEAGATAWRAQTAVNFWDAYHLKFTHVALSYGGGTNRHLYVNGAVVPLSFSQVDNLNVDLPQMFGANPNTNVLQFTLAGFVSRTGTVAITPTVGGIDDYRFYKGTNLSIAQITNIFDSTKATYGL